MELSAQSLRPTSAPLTKRECRADRSRNPASSGPENRTATTRGIGWRSYYTRYDKGGERWSWRRRRSRISTASGIPSRPRAPRSESSTVARDRTSFRIRMRATGFGRFSIGTRRGGKGSRWTRGPGDLSGSRVHAGSAQVGGVPPRARGLAAEPESGALILGQAVDRARRRSRSQSSSSMLEIRRRPGHRRGGAGWRAASDPHR